MKLIDATPRQVLKTGTDDYYIRFGVAAVGETIGVVFLKPADQ